MNYERIAQREELVNTTRELMARIDLVQKQVNELREILDRNGLMRPSDATHDAADDNPYLLSGEELARALAKAQRGENA